MYKVKDPYSSSPTSKSVKSDLFKPPDGQMETSQVLFKRLANKGAIVDSSRCSLLTDKGRGGSARTQHTDRKAPNFQQWVRLKDAEKRLKKKLI